MALSKSMIVEPWEAVYSTTHDLMERTPVEGGFLYRNWVQTGSDSPIEHIMLAYVPGGPLPPPVDVEVPHLMGVGAVGEVLTCTMGIWENTPTSYEYQWRRDGVDTGPAGPGDTYIVTEADAGASIDCIVTATNSTGSTAAPPSNAVEVTV